MKVEEAIDKAWWAREGVYKRARFDMLDETDAEYASIIEAGNKAMLTSLRKNGFVVVPVEATEKMMRSACEIDCGLEVCDDAGKCAHDTRWQLYAETWRYMIAAAQETNDGLV